MSNLDNGSTRPAKDENHKSVPESTKGQNETKDNKLSGAALKKKAKEEKAAKRAREKQNQQQAAGTEALGGKPELSSNNLRRSAPASGQDLRVKKQQQHKKTGSISANSGNPLALRQVESKPTSAPLPEPTESKHVALFGHLYGTSRRTTIAGAGKDVHPAVLALGLQMSNYVVCGSNARCVATLLVFKRVRIVAC